MAASSEDAISELVRCAARLQTVATDNPESFADPELQLAAENAVAAGVAWLADEPVPTASTEPPVRPILAKDLLLTVDLVHRSLQAHRS